VRRTSRSNTRSNSIASSSCSSRSLPLFLSLVRVMRERIGYQPTGYRITLQKKRTVELKGREREMGEGNKQRNRDHLMRIQHTGALDSSPWRREKGSRKKKAFVQLRPRHECFTRFHFRGKRIRVLEREYFQSF
jgi:hypothetical protein